MEAAFIHATSSTGALPAVAMVDPTTLPPSSVILLFWAGGAFLMSAKRLSEFREIGTFAW
jgi:hypothetical protein